MRYVGAIVGILLILVVTGCAEEEASPASQPTAVAATTSPESTATQPIPSPTRPTATATTVPPTATPKPSQPPAVATAAPASPTSQPTAVTASQPEPVTSTVYVGNTDGDGVFLRRTPNLADRIAAYPDDTQLVVLGPDTSENGITWKHVRAPDGRVGYVPAQYTVAASPTSQPPVIATAAPASPTSQPPTVTAVQPEPEPPTVYVGNTDGDGVFLRRTPNLADRIAAYPDDTQLVVLGPDTSENGITWKHVRAPDGKVGYVPAQYTVAAAAAAPPPGTRRQTAAPPTVRPSARAVQRQVQAVPADKRGGRHCLSAWDGNHNGFEALVRDVLKDPGSMETIETWVQLVSTTDLGTGHYIKMQYRAKNSLGGYVVNTAYGWFDNQTCQATLLYIAE